MDYILFGQSIDEGMKFVGPFTSEAHARASKHTLDFDETFEKLAIQYDWRIIELHSCLMNASRYPSTMTQVL